MPQNNPKIILYPLMICLIQNAKYAVCEDHPATDGNNFIRNITIQQDFTKNISDVRTNLFELSAENREQIFSNETESTHSMESIFSNLINVQDIYVLPVVCPIGIIGNGLVAHNLFSKRKTNSSYIYMAFILLADIFSLVSDLCLPFSRILQLVPSEMAYHVSVQIYFWNARILSVAFRRFSLNVFCVLSFERLTAIITPIKLYRSMTVTRPYLFIVLTFIASILPSIFTAFIGKLEMKYDIHSDTIKYNYALTDLYNTHKEYFSVILIVFRFLDGPVQIIFFSIVNALIIRGLYYSKTSIALASNKDRTRTISKLQTRLFKIFLILSFTNMLAFLPQAVSVIVAKLFPDTVLNMSSPIMKTVMFGGNFLRVFNSLTDFLVFLTVSKEIRREIYRKMICRKPRTPRSSLYTCSTGHKNTLV